MVFSSPLQCRARVSTWIPAIPQSATDAQVLVQAIKGDDYDFSVNGVLFRKIKSVASLRFSSFSISFCPRACNSVANALAMHGAKLVHAPQAVWPGHAPSFVQRLVASDAAVLSG
jgi:hypothetical protein